jgi:hypothetical protein
MVDTITVRTQAVKKDEPQAQKSQNQTTTTPVGKTKEAQNIPATFREKQPPIESTKMIVEGNVSQQQAQQPKEETTSKQVNVIPAVLQIREKEAPESTLERNKEQKSNWKRIAEKIGEFWGKYMVPLEPAVVLSLSGIAMVEASSLFGSVAVVATAVGVTAVGGGIFITLLWIPELVKKAMNERKEKAKQQVQEQKEENKPNIFEKVKGSLINFVEKVKKKEEEGEEKIKKAVDGAKERIKTGFSGLKVKIEDEVNEAKEWIKKHFPASKEEEKEEDKQVRLAVTKKIRNQINKGINTLKELMEKFEVYLALHGLLPIEMIDFGSLPEEEFYRLLKKTFKNSSSTKTS